MEVLETVGFDGLFSFTYSPRPGTTALRLDDDVPEEEKSRRLQLLNARQQQWQRRRNEALVGRRDCVLVETRDPDGRISGRTPHFRIVHLDGPKGLIGSVVPVEIVAAAPNSLQGRLSQPLH
jgi:tRNA-2-methylthio-N6-dimethylallyladenosine synthase